MNDISMSRLFLAAQWRNVMMRSMSSVTVSALNPPTSITALCWNRARAPETITVPPSSDQPFRPVRKLRRYSTT